MHLTIVGVAVVDGLLNVTRQLRNHLGTVVWLRRRRLERTGRQDALEPRQPLSENGRRVLVRLVVPVQHLSLERDADLGAVGAKHALCRHSAGPYAHTGVGF